MYEAFYGLRERPFNLTPDPRFLYLSEKHKEAFAHLLFGIKNRSGFILVSGEVGTGKTTICRTLINQLDDQTKVAFIFNPALSRDDLLRTINEEFGIISRGESAKELVDELNAYLLEEYRHGNNCVLIIDEAQDLEPEVLEQIRLLSNLETERQKLLQIALIGQPELTEKLALESLRQLDQRITARYHLGPLSRNDTVQYVGHRLHTAGGQGKVRFSPGALRRVYRFSKGTPRLINAICDRALLVGYTLEVHEISASIAKRAASEVGSARRRRRKQRALSRYMPTPGLLAAAVLIVLLGQFVIIPLTQRPIEQPNTVPPASASAFEEYRAAPTPDDPAPAEQEEGPPRVVEEPAEEPPDARFAAAIDAMAPDDTREQAAKAILRAWHMALLGDTPESDSLESLAAFAEANRLAYEILPLTLDELLTINFPAFVKLQGEKQAVWLGLTAIDGETLQLTTGTDERMFIEKGDFERCYSGEAVVLWRDPAPEAGVLTEETRGEDVRVLQVQLRALGRLNRLPTGVYDKETAAAVAQLQEDTGLKVDGFAGQQTRMVLSSWLPGFPTPSLEPRPLPQEQLRALAKELVATEIAERLRDGETLPVPPVEGGAEAPGTLTPPPDETPTSAPEAAVSPPETAASPPETLVSPPETLVSTPETSVSTAETSVNTPETVVSVPETSESTAETPEVSESASLPDVMEETQETEETAEAERTEEAEEQEPAFPPSEESTTEGAGWLEELSEPVDEPESPETDGPPDDGVVDVGGTTPLLPRPAEPPEAVETSPPAKTPEEAPPEAVDEGADATPAGTPLVPSVQDAEVSVSGEGEAP